MVFITSHDEKFKALFIEVLAHPIKDIHISSYSKKDSTI